MPNPKDSKSGEVVVLEGTIHDVLHEDPLLMQKIVFTPDHEFAGESWFNAHDEAHVRLTIEPIPAEGPCKTCHGYGAIEIHPQVDEMERYESCPDCSTPTPEDEKRKVFHSKNLAEGEGAAGPLHDLIYRHKDLTVEQLDALDWRAEYETLTADIAALLGGGE